MLRTRTALRAFALAPLAAPLAWWIDVIIEGLWQGRSVLPGLLPSLAMSVAMGFPIACAAIIAVGLPGLLLARRLQVVSMIGTIVTGVVAGAATGWMLTPWFTAELFSIPMGPVRGAACGAAVASAWWYFARETSDQS
jgi:hypothetical protein